MATQDTVTYGIAHGTFFESPGNFQDEDQLFDLTNCKLPKGWNRQAAGLFINLRPTQHELPDQGWKIHVSATPGFSEEVLHIVWNYCLNKRIAFKFLKSRGAVLVTNSKYWNRSASGKFITIYPANNDQLTSTLQDLNEALKAYPGPYILSDVRYGNGPLYTRYGAFKAMWLRDEEGKRTPAIRNKAGQLIPDVRDAIFSLPNFVVPPAVIKPFIQNRSASLEESDYTFHSVLHYSNGGGVYLGTHKPSNTRVALKEARPFAGLDDREEDAVTRLQNEYRILQQLQGLDCVLTIVDQFELWEHQYMATEFIEGDTLFNKILRTYPLVSLNQDQAELANYRDWAEGVYQQLVKMVKACHERGIAIVDLHPSNVMVKPSGELVLIDFECATSLQDSKAASLGSPGFIAPAHLTREEGDWYALERVRLMMLIPMVPLLRLDPSKVKTLLDVVCEHFPIEPQLKKNLTKGLHLSVGSEQITDEAAFIFAEDTYNWPRVKELLIDSIVRHATPERKDRLFPGDSLQFTYGGATLAYGAAGVLLALKRAEQQLSEGILNWLHQASFEPRNRQGFGLYDGLHGIAYVLQVAGAPHLAEQVMNQATQAALPTRLDLFGGQAGIALNLLYFGRETTNSQLITKALEIGQTMQHAVQTGSGRWREMAPGLMTGATGMALLFVHLFEETGDQDFLDAAKKALRHDLRVGRALPDGTYHLHIGTKYLPYFDGGSVGTAFVIDRFLRQGKDEELAIILDKVQAACRIPFVYQPGLFQGRAGLISLLAASKDNLHRSHGYQQAYRLGWHACRQSNHLMFPGKGLARYSMDLATGTAGILMALQALEDQQPLGLPYL